MDPESRPVSESVRRLHVHAAEIFTVNFRYFIAYLLHNFLKDPSRHVSSHK